MPMQPSLDIRLDECIDWTYIRQSEYKERDW